MSVSLVCSRSRSRRDIALCERVVRLVAADRGIRIEELKGRERLRHEVTQARQIAMYLCHVMLEMTMTEVGAIFGRDRTTVAHACARVEDARESVRVDRRITALERKIAGLDGRRAIYVPRTLSGEDGHASR